MDAGLDNRALPRVPEKYFENNSILNYTPHYKLADLNIDYDIVREELLEAMALYNFESYEDYILENTMDFWQALFLRNITKSIDKDFINPSMIFDKEYLDEWGQLPTEKLHRTKLCDIMPYTTSLVNQLVNFNECDRIFITKLKANRQMGYHSHITNEPSNFRYIHIPLVTNKDCKMSVMMDDEIHEEHYGLNQAWIINSYHNHKAINNSDEDRYHLVIVAKDEDKLFQNHFAEKTINFINCVYEFKYDVTEVMKELKYLNNKDFCCWKYEVHDTVYVSDKKIKEENCWNVWNFKQMFGEGALLDGIRFVNLKGGESLVPHGDMNASKPNGQYPDAPFNTILPAHIFFLLSEPAGDITQWFIHDNHKKGLTENPWNRFQYRDDNEKIYNEGLEDMILIDEYQISNKRANLFNCSMYHIAKSNQKIPRVSATFTFNTFNNWNSIVEMLKYQGVLYDRV